MSLCCLPPIPGHDNAYVRRGAAAAIAESVELWPQAVHSTVSTLQQWYREKAKILAPEFDHYVGFFKMPVIWQLMMFVGHGYRGEFGAF